MLNFGKKPLVSMSPIQSILVDETFVRNKLFKEPVRM